MLVSDEEEAGVMTWRALAQEEVDEEKEEVGEKRTAPVANATQQRTPLLCLARQRLLQWQRGLATPALLPPQGAPSSVALAPDPEAASLGTLARRLIQAALLVQSQRAVALG